MSDDKWKKGASDGDGFRDNSFFGDDAPEETPRQNADTTHQAKDRKIYDDKRDDRNYADQRSADQGKQDHRTAKDVRPVVDPQHPQKKTADPSKSNKSLKVTESGKKKKKKKWSTKRKAITFSLFGVLLALVITGGVYAYNIIYNPSNLFKTIDETKVQATPAPTMEAVPSAQATEAVKSDYENILSQADLDMMKNTVNVLLIGVDYADERLTWSGKHAFHADVMLVLAINFEKNTVDMISLPRDTYAKVPGVDGIYKMNASLDCGGGFPDGFPKVCETASWMLGNIPVDYYVAVTMPAVKELVNEVIGGVTYDLDIDFTLAGRSYKKGTQFMDGQGVLDYLRVRKNIAQSGDANRVNRQKKMLVCVFDEIKKQNLMLKIPDILKAFDGQLYTNMGWDQIASLALFGYQLPSSSIAMHSMGGTMTDIFNWSFCLTDQKARVELIKQVYGIDVPIYEEYTAAAAHKKWNGMCKSKYLSNGNGLLSTLERKLSTLEDEYEKMKKQLEPSPSPTKSASPTKSSSPTKTAKPTKTASPTKTTAPTPDPTVAPTAEPTTAPTTAPTTPPEDASAYLVNVAAVRAAYTQADLEKKAAQITEMKTKISACSSAISSFKSGSINASSFKSKISSIASSVGYSCSWTVSYKNEIEVDPR